MRVCVCLSVSLPVCVQVHVCVSVRMHGGMCVCARMHTCVHTCMCLHMYIKLAIFKVHAKVSVGHLHGLFLPLCLLLSR